MLMPLRLYKHALTVTTQVWSFSPPPDDERPYGMGPLEDPERPKSALPFSLMPPQPPMPPGLPCEDSGIADVDMTEAGPSTAPLQQGSALFQE